MRQSSDNEKLKKHWEEQQQFIKVFPYLYMALPIQYLWIEYKYISYKYIAK